MRLKKCKCNWFPYVARITDHIWDHALGYYVYCEKCGKRGEMMPTEAEAINAWNEKEEETQC